MLLRRLETRVSGYHRKIYMTNAQLRAAKAGYVLLEICVRVSGAIREERGFALGSMESLARESITRAKT